MGCTSINQAEKGSALCTLSMPRRPTVPCPRGKCQGQSRTLVSGTPPKFQAPTNRFGSPGGRRGGVGKDHFSSTPCPSVFSQGFGGPRCPSHLLDERGEDEGFLICLTIISGGIVDLQETRRGEVNGVAVLTCHLLILVFFDC